jgi:hypothetical protein
MIFYFFQISQNRLSGEDPQKDLTNMATDYGEVGVRVEFVFKNPTKLVTHLLPRSRYGDFKFFPPPKK